MEEHLPDEDHREECKHRDGEDGLGVEDLFVGGADDVEEEEDELHEDEAGHHAVHRRRVNVLVDL